MNLPLFILLLSLQIHSTVSSQIMRNPKEDVCMSGVDYGISGHGAGERFHFNSSSCKCEKFNYGGFAGNQNNFANEAECQKNCDFLNEIPKEKDCMSPPDPKSCTRVQDMFYFNATSGKCDKFPEGTCGGNGNIFMWEDLCLIQCNKKCKPQQHAVASAAIWKEKETKGKKNSKEISVCDEKMEPGMCSSDSNYATMWYYNKADGVCTRFHYSGCGGNGNKFDSENDCKAACQNRVSACELPAIRGPCSGNESSYFFNKNTGKCELFSYSGCLGNSNRFVNVEECRAKCLNLPSSEAVCQLPALKGPCSGNFRYYFFNKNTGRCEEFSYSGCHGNNNRFATVEECKWACPESELVAPPLRRPGPRLNNVCDEKKEVGKCSSDDNVYTTKWYYNKSDGVCDRFHYSGCGGSGNRFDSEADCKAACQNHVSACDLPVVRGLCSGNRPSYFFNKGTGKCERFSYSGCLGNINRFRTVEECQAKCPGRK